MTCVSCGHVYSLEGGDDPYLFQGKTYCHSCYGDLFEYLELSEACTERILGGSHPGYRLLSKEVTGDSQKTLLKVKIERRTDRAQFDGWILMEDSHIVEIYEYRRVLI